MRIAHIDTESTWRGGEQQVFSLIKGLKEKGHENWAVVKKGSALEERLQHEGVKTFPVSPWGEWDCWAAHQVNRFFKKEKIDICHAHSGHGVALGVFSALGTSIPVLATRRVDFPLSQNFFSRLKYHRLKKIVAISHGVEKVLIESGIPQEKIVMVPSGIDFEKFNNLSRSSKQELGVGPNSIVIGQVAALAPHKDQATFLKAIALVLKKNPNVVAVLVGEGPLRNELEQLAASLQIQQSVRFLGFKSDPLYFLSAFDYFCLSSREEGLGTSLLDAMALQIPIIATRAGGIPELIEDGVTGLLVTPQSPESLSQTLLKAINNKDLWPPILSQALKKSQKFNITQTISKMDQLYHSLCYPQPYPHN